MTLQIAMLNFSRVPRGEACSDSRLVSNVQQPQGSTIRYLYVVTILNGELYAIVAYKHGALGAPSDELKYHADDTRLRCLSSEI
jgi:hypothetical protein